MIKYSKGGIQMIKSTKLLKIVLGIVAVYHILLGIAGILIPADLISKLASQFFYFTLTVTPEVGWVIRPFASYLLVFGVFMGVAALDPSKYKLIIYGGISLFVVRIIQRLYFMARGFEEFGTDPVRSWLHIGVVTILAIALIVLVRKEK